jgi:hypothetical protein
MVKIYRTIILHYFVSVLGLISASKGTTKIENVEVQGTEDKTEPKREAGKNVV